MLPPGLRWSLLLSTTLLLALARPAPAQTLTVIVDPAGAGFDLGDSVSPGKVVALSVGLEDAAGSGAVAVKCASSEIPSSVQVAPEQVQTSAEASPLVFVALQESELDTTESRMITITCSDVAGVAVPGSVELSIGPAPGRVIGRLDAGPEHELVQGIWFPIDFRFADPEVARYLREKEVEWRPLGSHFELLNRASTLFDETMLTTNMVRFEPETTEPLLLLAQIVGGDEHGAIEHLLHIPPPERTFDPGMRRIEIDPRFTSRDDQDALIPLFLREGTVAQLTFRLIEGGTGEPVPVGRYRWSANWGRTLFESFAPEGRSDDRLEGALDLRDINTDAIPPGERPLLVAWAMENTGGTVTTSPPVAAREIEIKFEDKLPSIYGCSQAPGSGAGLALALLLFGGAVPISRGRRSRRAWASLAVMPFARLVLRSLLLGSLLWGLSPALANAQIEIFMNPITDHPLGLGTVLSPGRPVALGVRVEGQGNGEIVTLFCRSTEPDIVLVHPSETVLPDGAAHEIYVQIAPFNTGFTEDSILPIICELVADDQVNETFELAFSPTERPQAPTYRVEGENELRADIWWPITLAYEQDPGPANRSVEWHSLSPLVRLFNKGTTNFDPSHATANMIRLEPSTAKETLVLAWVREDQNPTAEVAMIIPLSKPNPGTGSGQGFSLDPRFNTFDEDGVGQELALKLKLGQRGRLRLHLYENDVQKIGESIVLDKAVWAVNWDHGFLEPFVVQNIDGKFFSTTIVCPDDDWEPPANADSPAIAAWAMESSTTLHPRVSSREIKVEFTDEPPSIYGCSSAPRSGAGLGLAVLLLGLLLVAMRERTIPRRLTPIGLPILLLGGLLLPTTALAGDPEPKKPGLAFTGVVAPPNADPDEVKAISEYLQTELIARGYYQVVGPGEIQALMGLEAQKQLLGCSESSAACLAEVGGALGSDRLLSGNVTRVGKSVILSLSLLDVQSARLIHRAGERVKVTDSLEPLLDVVPKILDEVISRDTLVLSLAAAAGFGPGATGTGVTATPPTPPKQPGPSSGDSTGSATVAASGLPPTGRGELGGQPPAVSSPGGLAATGPHPLARDHEGAGTFLVAYHHELALPLGGTFGIGLRWRRQLLGATISLQGHPSNDLTQPERSVGLRLGVRLYPKDLGRVAPFLGAGMSMMIPTFLPRIEGGAELALGNFRFTGTVAVEFLVNDLAFYAPVNPLLGLGVGYAF